MAKKELPKRRKQDLQERYTIRIQGGKSGLVEATSKMDIHEFRVFATMLTMVLPEDEDFTTYELRVQDIIKLFSLKKDGRYYELVRDAAHKLLDRKFVIYEMKNGEEYKTTINLITETSEPVSEINKNHILLQFSPKLKPYLLQLKKEYLTIDIRNIQDISSPYSVKLYMVLKHQQRLGNYKVKYPIERLRQILAIEEGEYGLYGSFKQQVIRRTLSDIEKYTDLSVLKIEEEKAGRSVSAIIFHVVEKEAQRQNEIKIKKQQHNILKKSDGRVVVGEDGEKEPISFETAEVINVKGVQLNEIENVFQKVRKYKIAKATVRQWFNEFPIEQITLGIDHVLSEVKVGKEIKNIGGYINQMVKTSSLFEVAQEQKTEQERKRMQQQEKQQQEKTLNEQVNSLKIQAHNMRLEVLAELVQNQEIKQALIDKFSVGLFKTYYKPSLGFEENIKNPAVAGFMIATAGQLYPERFVEAEQLVKRAEALERGR
ncbi:replication initiation protein (plasmid) [Runella rosea]|uniref:Replication initiation protein n=1 Tax=Runella rosea TaxID=2259595 RepID=A0A344TTG5_9BACT|nr:replication initiation protein [Runella rosea]AXE21936.1 replication initiation protein [Runella rosea]